VLSGLSASTNGHTGLPANATHEDGEPYILGNTTIGGRSVWFRWTAPVTALARVDTAGSGFNTMLGVYTGTAVNALSLVASNDNAPGVNTSLLEFQAAAGTTYSIVVDGRRNFGGVQSGPYNLNLRVLASVVLTTPTNGSLLAYGNPVALTGTASTPGAR